MKALFWNIGKKLTDKKKELISEALATELPDIFCIAEGTTSAEKCQTIVDLLGEHDYTCYYSPLFVRDPALKLDYDYKPQGLKIFYRKDKIVVTPFTFSYQREMGRIIVLKATESYKETTYIFLHNLSKSGNAEVTYNQSDFISNLRGMISIGKITSDTEKVDNMGERVVIMGDFNLEPWDSILKLKRFLTTSFFQMHNAIHQRKRDDEKYFFNPSVELILNSDVANLGGTFYSDTSGWALYDFVLFDTKDVKATYKILTEFKDGHKLLNYDNTIVNSFLNHELDHLPIVVEIDNK